jgi:23S rRNA pseudouridine1911/1915/1917 synthase
MQPDVVYEDNHLLVVNKPAGMLAQGDRTGDPTLLDVCKDYIAKKYQKPGKVFLGLVHRLDRPVGGVVVLARTSKALRRLNTLFKNREVQKMYRAITDKKPDRDAGTLIHWIAKDGHKNKVHVYRKPKEGALECELHYTLRIHRNGLYLIEVLPVTGRPHQIRAQLAAIGCPILGDVKYGSAAPISDGNIALYACSLTLMHPVKKEKLLFEAPLPDTDYWSVFRERQ